MSSSIPTPERQKIDQVAFSVRARVAMQLGRESISSSIVAIIELVKNAYDADASNVWIRFFDLNTSHAALIIEDDGSGMTHEQLANNWMVIGTDNKAQSRRSNRKARTLVGEKGLGRLGLDRLSHTTRVQTFTEAEQNFGIELEIQWTEYEAHSSDSLESIQHDLFVIPKTQKHGTRLILEDLKDSWHVDALKDLNQDLSLLVSPFASMDDFKIWLNTGEGDIRVGSEYVLDAAEWKLVTYLQLAETSRETTSESLSKWNVVREITDPEGRTSTTTIEWRDHAGTSNCACGPSRLELYFYSRGDTRNDEADENFTRSQIKEFLETNQGIRIYRDGFRVQPYGNPSAAGEGDWLSLNMRRVTHPSGVIQEGRWRVGYNQVIGAVFISKEDNPQLVDQTNREGLVDGNALSDLRTFALNSVEFFEERRQIYERSQHKLTVFETASQTAATATDEALKTAARAEEAMNTLPLWTEAGSRDPKQIAETTAKIKEVQRYVKDLQRVVKRADRAQATMQQAYEDRARAYEEKENTLANLASLGILAAVFGHETVNHTNRVVTNTAMLKEIIAEVEDCVEQVAFEEIEQCIARIDNGAQRIQTFAKFTIGNVRTDKRYRKLTNLYRVAKDVVEAFELSTRNIKVSVEAQNSVKQIRAFRIDWESIFINLLTNAVWALNGTEGDQRAIRIRFWTTDRTLHISFDDGGKGIEPGTIDRIFEPTFSTRRNSRGDVVGTGMGLSIVQNLVRNYNGSINVQYNGDLGGAHFHITVPVRDN